MSSRARRGVFAVCLLLVAAPLRADTVESLFDAYGSGIAPGCAFGTLRESVVTTGARGYADIEARTPLTPDTVFNIASVSKQFTAFAVLLLEQRRQLRLDESIRTYVPELGVYAQPVTLRHLLHHTGGLREYVDLLLLAGHDFGEPTTQQRALELLALQTGANFAANERYAYSNTGYFLLGLVVERRSGESLAQLSMKNIFGPLGMTHTRIVDRYPARIATLARGYSPAGTSFVIDESLWQQTGDGQVHTTVADLLRWQRNFDTAAVGGRALLDRLMETGVLSSGARIDYAAGLRVGNYRNLRSVSHGGDWMGYVAHARRFPTQRYSAVVLCNRSDADPASYTARMADIDLKAALHGPATSAPTLLKPHSPQTDAPRARAGAPAQCVTGTYTSRETPAQLVIEATAGKLAVRYHGKLLDLVPGASHELTGQGIPSDGDTFTLRFEPQDMRAFRLFTAELRGLVFASPTPACAATP